jgi:hypothetical protein
MGASAAAHDFALESNQSHAGEDLIHLPPAPHRLVQESRFAKSHPPQAHRSDPVYAQASVVVKSPTVM